ELRAESVNPGAQLNIGFMNPHMGASIWKWRPDKPGQNEEAMDMHRESDHHEGEFRDPLEGAINNVFHQREELFGVRKEHTVSYIDLGHKMETYESRLGLAKSEVGAEIIRDTVKLTQALEREGKIVPWSVVDFKSEEGWDGVS